MAGKRPRGRPSSDLREFTAEHIEFGIRKLRRRIEEVQALDPAKIRYDDARVKTVTRDIRDDLDEIFGDDSREADALGGHSVSYPEQLGIRAI